MPAAIIERAPARGLTFITSLATLTSLIFSGDTTKSELPVVLCSMACTLGSSWGCQGCLSSYTEAGEVNDQGWVQAQPGPVTDNSAQHSPGTIPQTAIHRKWPPRYSVSRYEVNCKTHQLGQCMCVFVAVEVIRSSTTHNIHRTWHSQYTNLQ